MVETQQLRSKLTRGEKCILSHIVVTLLVLLVLLIIYVAHLLLVTHNGWEVFRVSRRSGLLHGTNMTDLLLMIKDVPVGVAYIKSRPARASCNTILLKPKWSLAPAHCLSVRSEPELASLLPLWRIRYKDSGQMKETDIKRSIFHSYYNKDDFSNNIGLFQHMDQINIKVFEYQLKWTPVRVLSHARCAQFVAPVVDVPRESELCVYQTREGSRIEGVHGGALWFRGQIVGLHTWGDRSSQLPQVALLVEPYRAWLEDTIHMNL